MRGTAFLAAVSCRPAVFTLALLIAAGMPARAAEPSTETPSSKLADNPDRHGELHKSLRERSIGQFEQMCEFIELSSGQMEQALELFESRIGQMALIFRAVREGKLNQQERQEKLTRSFAEHRKDFESILTRQQQAKLKLWEKKRTDRNAKS